MGNGRKTGEFIMRINRLWVVETKLGDNSWGICSFTRYHLFASTNYYATHRMKRKIQEYLIRGWLPEINENFNFRWTKKRFRVREYERR